MDEKDLKKAVEILNITLCDHMVLTYKTLGYHWNVEGMHFSALHSLFEEIYSSMQEKTDELAERIRYLGAKSPKSLSDFLKHARLKEEEEDKLSEKAMIKNLLHDFEKGCEYLRSSISQLGECSDTGSEDYLTSLLQVYEKAAWMLRAHH